MVDTETSACVCGSSGCATVHLTVVFATRPTDPLLIADRLNSTAQTLPETLFVFNVVFGPVEQCENLTLLESVGVDCDSTNPSQGPDISLTNLIAGDMSGPDADAVDRRAQLEAGLISIQTQFDETIDIQETTDKLRVYKDYVDHAWESELFFPSFLNQTNTTLQDIYDLIHFDAVNDTLWPLEPRAYLCVDLSFASPELSSPGFSLPPLHPPLTAPDTSSAR